MKETPIIFSTELIPKILDGSKTQTRRVIKPQPPKHWSVPPARFSKGYFCQWGAFNAEDSIKCPYGQVGDRLWVRETWHSIEHPTDREKEFVTYKATAQPHILKTVKWRPSIHMPRWASRITLEITEIRAERLQEITEEDATAEGIEGLKPSMCCYTNRYCFKVLWDSLNAKRGFDWASNPWCWCISFKVVDSVARPKKQRG